MKYYLRIIVILVFGIYLGRCGVDDETESSQTFNISFQAIDFHPHNEQLLTAAIVDRSDGTIVGQESTVIENGEFSLQWLGLLKESGNYFLDYYVDMNGNGSCDEPQTDHSWRVKIEEVSGDLNFTDSHHTDFKRICSTFSDPTEANSNTTELQISGQLNLDETISEIEGQSAGAALEGATVFVEGYPEYEAKTDAQGAFTLNIEIPSSSLLANNYQVVMWFTKENDDSDIITWDTEAVRVGAKKAVSYEGNSSEIDMGSVSLLYTKKAKINLKDSESSANLSNCWVEIPDYGFQLIVKPKDEGIYLIDYLPEGSYKVNVDCLGYVAGSETIQIEKANGLDEIQEIPPITLTPKTI